MIALLAAVGGTGATIYDYHKALQFLGVLGLLVTAVLRYNSFKVRLPFSPDSVEGKPVQSLCCTRALMLAAVCLAGLGQVCSSPPSKRNSSFMVANYSLRN